MSHCHPMSDDFWQKFDVLGEHIGLTKANRSKIKARGTVPPKHYYPLIKQAEKLRVPLTLQELETFK